MPEERRVKKAMESCPTKDAGENRGKKGGKRELPPIVREVPDPPVPNRAHTEM